VFWWPSCAFMFGTDRLALGRVGDFNRTSSSEMDRLVGAEPFRNFGAWAKPDFWIALDILVEFNFSHILAGLQVI
jgi:hypothetical protein